MGTKNSETKLDTSDYDLASQGQALRVSETKTKKPKRKLPLGKILVAGIVILITLLAFGLIAYLVMGQNKTQKITNFEECVAAGFPIMESYPEQCAANGQTFTRELTPEEQSKLNDPTADWETYNNSDYNFSFKYPLEWQLSESPSEYLNIIITPDPSDEKGFPPIQISIDSTTDNAGKHISFSTIQDAVDHYSQDFDENTLLEESFAISGKQAIKVSGQLKGPGPGQRSRLGYTFVQLANKVLVIQLGDLNSEPILNQILSTFKFTEASNVDTSDWKTYENSKFGFTVKYPPNWITTKLYSPKSSSYTHLNLGFAPSQKVVTGYEYIFTIEHYDNPNNLSFQDWDTKENEDKQMTRFLNSSDTKTENYAGYKAYVNEKGNCEPVFCKEVIIMHDKNIFVFRNIDFTNLDYTKEEIESYKPLFEQMLSTFKFTN